MGTCSIKTYFKGDKLIIEQQGASINVNGGNIQIIRPFSTQYSSDTPA
ncbi:MAG TPA: hypothetical protein VGC62_10315 [Pseudomonas sp.]